MSGPSSSAVEYFWEDGIVFAFRDRHMLWVWRDDHWEHEPSGTWLTLHLHQAAYRGDGRARRLDGPPEGAPEPPARPPKPVPTPQGVHAPALAKQLGRHPRHVHLVLSYDEYDARLGDGRIDLLRGAFLDKEDAKACAARITETVTRRTIELQTDGEHIRLKSGQPGPYETWDLEAVVSKLQASTGAS
jgi:hypothetical protein